MPSTGPCAGKCIAGRSAARRAGQIPSQRIYAKFPFGTLSRDALNRYLDAEIKLAILYARDGLYDRAETLLAEVAGADAASPLCAQAVKLRQDIRQQRQKAAQ